MKKQAVLFLSCVSIAFFSAPHTRAQDTLRWTPELSMRYHALGDVAMSPDGRLIAYTIRKPLMEGEKSEYLSHIRVTAADGSFNVQHTQGDESCSNPAFSPDGQHIAFLSF
jgi:dipeptidyl aminopeptidase/acylaminoacyl peptidase